MLAYFYLSTHTLTVTVTDSAGDTVTGATVTVTLVDRAGTEISGQTWPLSLSDQSDGDYTGTVESDLSVSIGQQLTAQVSASKSGQDRYAEVSVEVRVDRD